MIKDNLLYEALEELGNELLTISKDLFLKQFGLDPDFAEYIELLEEAIKLAEVLNELDPDKIIDMIFSKITDLTPEEWEKLNEVKGVLTDLLKGLISETKLQGCQAAEIANGLDPFKSSRSVSCNVLVCGSLEAFSFVVGCVYKCDPTKNPKYIKCCCGTSRSVLYSGKGSTKAVGSCKLESPDVRITES
jgi:hypothetical protein